MDTKYEPINLILDAYDFEEFKKRNQLIQRLKVMKKNQMVYHH